jgi:hypothetical protein
MELIDILTKSLGISDAQASGGAGLLLKQAKEKLGSNDFSQVSAVVPEADSLIKAAPASNSGGGGMGGLGNIVSGLGLGGSLGGLGNLASLAGGFSKLGLNSSMISKFIPLILSFVESKGGAGVKAILEKVIK